MYTLQQASLLSPQSFCTNAFWREAKSTKWYESQEIAANTTIFSHNPGCTSVISHHVLGELKDHFEVCLLGYNEMWSLTLYKFKKTSLIWVPLNSSFIMIWHKLGWCLPSHCINDPPKSVLRVIVYGTTDLFSPSLTPSLLSTAPSHLSARTALQIWLWVPLQLESIWHLLPSPERGWVPKASKQV